MRVITHREVALAQGIFYIVTGLWPVVNLRSFEGVTGPKQDGWLVKTVGLVIAVVGVALAAAGRRRAVAPELKLLGMGSAAALGSVDVFYTARRRIAPIYLLDALAELLIILAWAGSDEGDG